MNVMSGFWGKCILCDWEDVALEQSILWERVNQHASNVSFGSKGYHLFVFGDCSWYDETGRDTLGYKVVQGATFSFARIHKR